MARDQLCPIPNPDNPDGICGTVLNWRADLGIFDCNECGATVDAMDAITQREPGDELVPEGLGDEPETRDLSITAEEREALAVTLYVLYLRSVREFHEKSGSQHWTTAYFFQAVGAIAHLAGELRQLGVSLAYLDEKIGGGSPGDVEEAEDAG